MQLCLKKAKAAWDAIVYWENSKSGEVKLQVKFPVEKTPWL